MNTKGILLLGKELKGWAKVKFMKSDCIEDH